MYLIFLMLMTKKVSTKSQEEKVKRMTMKICTKSQELRVMMMTMKKCTKSQELRVTMKTMMKWTAVAPVIITAEQRSLPVLAPTAAPVTIAPEQRSSPVLAAAASGTAPERSASPETAPGALPRKNAKRSPITGTTKVEGPNVITWKKKQKWKSNEDQI